MIITELAQRFGQLLHTTVKVVHTFGQKIRWATFWAFVPHTRLVTLIIVHNDNYICMYYMLCWHSESFTDFFDILVNTKLTYLHERTKVCTTPHKQY
jgi:hypothetical protein